MWLVFWLRRLSRRLCGVFSFAQILQRLLRYPIQIWTILGRYLGVDTRFKSPQPPDVGSSTSRLPTIRMSDEFSFRTSGLVEESELISGNDMTLPVLRDGPEELNPPNIILQATVATHLRPKNKRPIVPRTTSTWDLEPCTTNFTTHIAPPGWTLMVQPQGALFFWLSDFNVLTDTYICDSKALKYTNAAIRKIQHIIRSGDLQLPLDIQLVLEINYEDENNIQCGYYFVSHEGRCLFWLENTDLGFLLENVNGVTHLDHIKHRIESEYWWHWQRFPNVQNVTSSILNELRGTLLCESIDLATNVLSTALYEPDEISLYLSLVNSLTGNLENEILSTHSAYIVGPLMAISSFQKFHNFHGQPSARLSRDQSVHAKRTQSIVMIVLSPLLFYSPDIYLQNLETILVDGYIFFGPWKRFVRELHAEWRDLTVIATVLLATNVAFLAIPTIDDGDPTPQRSAAQIVSYISVLSAVSSIILGQLLTRYNRVRGWETLDERVIKNFKYLTNIGLAKLAIMYSIPYALLGWGMITFLVAFLILCFRSTDTLVKLPVGISTGLIAVLMLLCLWKVGSRGEDSLWPTLAGKWKRMKERILVRTRQRVRRGTASAMPAVAV